ncbi:sulfotransferase [bacterium]|nr:MAG: sulfotransferase [bacterium]
MRLSLLKKLSPTTFVNRVLYGRAMSRPPIIIVGMHRSGTTLLGDLMERCGLFQGASLSLNRESVFFQDVNRDLLDVTGSSWRKLDFLPSHQEMVKGNQWMPQRAEAHFRRNLITQHFGSKKSLLLNANALWGWKEPRTSLFLPIYAKLFPRATVIHIYRDGRDVALSLLTRDVKRPGANPLTISQRQARFIQDMQLWQSYCERIEAARPLFPKSHIVRYEDLLANPLEEMQNLVDVCGLPSQGSLPDAIKILDPSRASRVEKGGAEWTQGLERHAPLLKELSYV